MRKDQIKVGGHYQAKVNGKLVTVRVDAVRETDTRRTTGVLGNRRTIPSYTFYDVTNLATGRKTTFRSAMKFRAEVAKTEHKRNPKSLPLSGAMASNPFKKKEPRDLLAEVEEDDYRDGGAEPKEGEKGSDPTTSKSSSDTSTARSVRSSETGSTSKTPVAGAVTAPPSDEAKQNDDGPLTGLLRRSLGVGLANDTSPHLIIEARAGTGKTTTLIEGLKEVKGIKSSLTPSPQQKAVWEYMRMSAGKANSIMFAAFNRSIADELKNRMPAGCEAATMHSLGFTAVKDAFPQLYNKKLNEYRNRDLIASLLGVDQWDLRRDPLLGTLSSVTDELVSLCKMNLIGKVEDKTFVVDPQELDGLIDHYGIEIEVPGVRERVYDLVPQVLAMSMDPEAGGMIGYDDMIWLPVILNLPVKKYDMLLVDEFQDQNRCQQALCKMMGRRLILCGDPCQAIYGFAGADSRAMARMEEELSGVCQETDHRLPFARGCVHLPLTVTRRCGKAIVAEAKKYVPDFEAHESNCEGKVSTASYTHTGGYGEFPKREVPWEKTYGPMVKPGDMVLCRTNAPLVSQCFKFIRLGIKANIQGRDVGQGLISLAKKLWKPGRQGMFADLAAFTHNLSEWKDNEIRKEEAKKNPSEAKVASIQDKHDCLHCFLDGAPTDLRSVDWIVAKIQTVFTDDKHSPGIRMSSIHKAKGLEAKRVFFLQPPGTGFRRKDMKEWEAEQERNLMYVGVTRAIEELTYVR